jgi:hypothetical protein
MKSVALAAAFLILGLCLGIHAPTVRAQTPTSEIVPKSELVEEVKPGD